MVRVWERFLVQKRLRFLNRKKWSRNRKLLIRAKRRKIPLRPVPESVMDLIKLSRQKGMAVLFLVSLPEPVTGKRWVRKTLG
nr:MAG TPA: hypothetical protein [Caudoviricetes sp.]DAX05047.1 MAG TPA: hypothetical protein [Caudoviricetes sp.]